MKDDFAGVATLTTTRLAGVWGDASAAAGDGDDEVFCVNVSVYDYIAGSVAFICLGRVPY